MTTYRISELASRTGIPPSTLRFYEQAGLLPAHRTASNYRVYDEAEVARLEFITAAKHLGLPLGEIRELLGAWRDDRARGKPHTEGGAVAESTEHAEGEEAAHAEAEESALVVALESPWR